MLMGTLKQQNQMVFFSFPVNPGKEELSWERLYREGIDRFFAGTFKGDYEEKLIKEFEAYLPEHPRWKQV